MFHSIYRSTVDLKSLGADLGWTDTIFELSATGMWNEGFDSHSSGGNWTLFNQQAAFLHLNNSQTGICEEKNSTNHRMHVNILQWWKGWCGLQPSFFSDLVSGIAKIFCFIKLIATSVVQKQKNADMSRTELNNSFGKVFLWIDVLQSMLTSQQPQWQNGKNA